MAALHAALKAIGPVDFADVPKQKEQLGPYLTELFGNAELILESIPIPAPSGSDQNEPHVASSASEITSSSARSHEPSPEHAALQKEWGKPLKVGAKENPLAMSVYKLSGKDSRGAWFARRSVHEGIGFARFRKSLEMEFEQSMAVDGPAGAGNVRGIGGETRVEEIDVPGKGKVEVFRLSAQFPGPTTPRDFVTMLVTSDKAMHNSPRHYMVISKPCNHPETQPQDGFIRGSYESCEFIREVPRSGGAQSDGKDSEDNPIEWIMVTRSDPGGSVPRFMVERGTPGSICSDGVKFLDWACQKSPDKVAEAASVSGDRPSTSGDRPQTLSKQNQSYQSWRGSRVAGVHEEESAAGPTPAEPATVQQPVAYTAPTASRAPAAPVPVEKAPDNTEQNGYGGILGSVTASLSAIAPQAVLDMLPGQQGPDVETAHKEPLTTDRSPPVQPPVQFSAATYAAHDAVHDDAASVMTDTSFASAEDHLSSSESDSATHSSNRLSQIDTSHQSHHEKELSKLESRRTQLTTKFAESRSKLDAVSTEQTAKEEAAHKKAIEKHEKEVAKQEEKYQKELRKLEQKQEKEKRKLESKRKKQEDKDDKTRLTRERDEARGEVDALKAMVADLQRENTALVARLGGTVA